jgi:hypothetical protein
MLRRLNAMSNNKSTDTPLILTLTGTVSAKDYKRFAADHTGPADIADSFETRLSEVFGSGPEVLTTVRVKTVETTATPTPATAPLLNEFYEREAAERSVNAERLAKKARKAVRRARRALGAYINGDEGLAEYVSSCYEGYPADGMEEAQKGLLELENTLRYIREQAPYDPARR